MLESDNVKIIFIPLPLFTFLTELRWARFDSTFAFCVTWKEFLTFPAIFVLIICNKCGPVQSSVIFCCSALSCGPLKNLPVIFCTDHLINTTSEDCDTKSCVHSSCFLILKVLQLMTQVLFFFVISIFSLLSLIVTCIDKQMF